MSDKSAIEWTDATWNPVRGCTKVSPGCKNCYAETFAERWRGVVGHPYEQGFDLRLVPEKLDEPLRYREPRKIFVNSMSDLFQDGVPLHYIASTYNTMAVRRVLRCRKDHEHEAEPGPDCCWRDVPAHTFQILTKRSERMMRVVNDELPWFVGESMPGNSALATAIEYGEFPMPKVWHGVSVEDRKYGLPRIEHLRDTNAAVRFLSIEPLLEDLGMVNLDGIHWVIVGGESGYGARPMHPGSVRSIRDQCLAAGVPFFFKQWGAWMPESAGAEWDPTLSEDDPRLHSWKDLNSFSVRVGKKVAGRILDGRTWDEFPKTEAA